MCYLLLELIAVLEETAALRALVTQGLGGWAMLLDGAAFLLLGGLLAVSGSRKARKREGVWSVLFFAGNLLVCVYFYGGRIPVNGPILFSDVRLFLLLTAFFGVRAWKLREK